jgi:FdhD protein
MDASTRRPIARLTATGWEEAPDHLVSEAPVEFSLGSVPVAVLMRTPGDDADLGLGFAITEGIVLGPHEVAAVVPSAEDATGDRWIIELSDGVTVDPEQFRRNLYTTSSCGVCGKASIDAVRVAAPPPPQGPEVTPAVLGTLPTRMRSAQRGFDRTGGIHAAGIFDAAGRLEALAEDVGRHNAVDKVLGRVARARWPIGPCLLVVSGRVSFEIVQKAAVAGVPFVAGVSAASSLAAELGEELGLTVVGFLRADGCNVYSGRHRIAGAPSGVPSPR